METAITPWGTVEKESAETGIDMTVLLENETGADFGFPLLPQLESCIRHTAAYVKCPYDLQISVTVTDREGIHKLNREFRGVDRPTDVLSFPMMEYDEPADFESGAFYSGLAFIPDTQELLLGDIVLCDEIVKEQAREYGHSIKRECCFLVVHSMLHLFGFDHMEDEERQVMEEHQRVIMNQLKVSRNEEEYE